MSTQKHNCSKCGFQFDAEKNRIRDLSWTSFLTRPAQLLPLGEDIETFLIVKCPDCGHIEEANELKIFFFIPGRYVKLVLVAFLIIILLFGYWLINFSPAAHKRVGRATAFCCSTFRASAYWNIGR